MFSRQYAGYGLFVLLITGGAAAFLLPADAVWAGWLIGIIAAVATLIGFDDFRRRHERVERDAAQALRRLAAGNFGEKFYAGGSRVLVDLARAHNAAAEVLATRITCLETERRQLLAILGGMAEGVISLDSRETVLFANPRAGQLLGFKPSQATGRRFWEIVRHCRMQELVTLAMSAPEAIREELEWPDPTVRHLAVYVARLSGLTPGAVLVVQDTSELRRLERVRQEFVANVSHELKTPLAVIKVCAETLLDGAASDPAARGAFLAQIDEQADRLHNLIIDLLSLAKIESGTATLDVRAIPLGPVVSGCLDRHRARAGAKEQKLESCPPSDPITAQVDEEALDTILDNLVDNAVKYTPTGGRVAIRWSMKGEQVCIDIEDTGVGIPERDQSRLFERFYRVDKARARELGGTGLGLSIVKHLVQAMGGEVGVHSTVGRGTTFTVRLPLAA